MEYNARIKDLDNYEDCLVSIECRILSQKELKTKNGDRIIIGVIEDKKYECDFIVHENNIESFYEYFKKNDNKFTGVVKRKKLNNEYIIVWSL